MIFVDLLEQSENYEEIDNVNEWENLYKLPFNLDNLRGLHHFWLRVFDNFAEQTEKLARTIVVCSVVALLSLPFSLVF